MSELEKAQHAYIVFLQDKLDKAEGCLQSQSWWGGFPDEEIKEGSEHRAKIVKIIANQEELCDCKFVAEQEKLCDCRLHTMFEIEMNSCAVCKKPIKTK
jgi:hypothetical protein